VLNFERFRFINNRQMDRGQNDFLFDVLQTIKRYLNCGKLILYIYLNIIVYVCITIHIPIPSLYIILFIMLYMYII